MLFDELSPMTQRSASTRFDLPHPFGPTMPVRPRLDKEFGRLDKGLEARDAEFGEFHGRAFVPRNVPLDHRLLFDKAS